MVATPKILIVDDEAGIVNVVASYLKTEGYEVQTASDGVAGLKAARALQPDLVILDIMLPGMDGLEVLSHLRRESQVYVILLTARTEEMDKIIGLSVGADDYVTKPFSPRELTARVKAALRRVQASEENGSVLSVLEFKHIRIDVVAHTISNEGEQVELTAIEFNLLVALAQAHGRVLSRAHLMEQVWGYGYFEDTRVVDVHLGHIRQKLGEKNMIKTIRGVGYRFEDEPL